jgi:hypothetical protein
LVAEVNRQAAWRFYELDLRTPDGWERLRQGLLGSRHLSHPRHSVTAAHTLIDNLRRLNVQSAIVEFPYHDDDFSEEYIAFHAGIFRPGPKACHRYHFFTVPGEDIGPFFRADAEERTRVKRLKNYSERQPVVFEGPHAVYVGFCVVRPTRDAPIGRTVIASKTLHHPIARILKSTHRAHLLGVAFEAQGFPFIEQDARTGACAQAALWMALRHLHQSERSRWLSLPRLTSEAALPLNEISARSVPAGSSGLDLENMLAAISAAGRFPQYLPAIQTMNGQRLDLTWLQDPIINVAAYVDSGIPVILLVTDTGKRRLREVRSVRTNAAHHRADSLLISDAHALTVIGYYGDNQRPKQRVKGKGADLADWIEGLIVHDDQVGPGLKLARVAEKSKPFEDSEYSLQNVFGIIVPRPDRVFLAPDTAQELAWMFVETHSSAWWRRHIIPAAGSGASRSPPHTLDRTQLVARTFLIRGYEHFLWLSEVKAHPDLVNLAAHVHCPRHIWVTEFYPVSKAGVPEFNEMVAHVVSDATSANISQTRSTVNDAFLFGHATGLAFGLVTRGPGEGKLVGAQIENVGSYASSRPILAHATRLKRV